MDLYRQSRARRVLDRRSALLAALASFIGLTLSIVPVAYDAAACAPYGADARAIETARYAVASACDCATASSRSWWHRCVTTALGELRDAGKLSRSCMAHAFRFEMDSTCGRPGTVVCCRQVISVHDLSRITFHTLVSVRPAAACAAPLDAVASRLAHVAEACSAAPPEQLVEPERCGNGRLDPGEECDSPDGKACTAWCRSCPASPGAITLSCTDGAAVVAAAVPGEFLVAFDRITRTSSRAVAIRMDASGVVRDDAAPVASDAASARGQRHTAVDSATSDGASFYVAWVASGAKHGRKVPVSGAIDSPIDQLGGAGSSIGVGVCAAGIGPRGPLDLAPTLDGSTVHATQVFDNGSICGAPDSIGGLPFRLGWANSTIVGTGGPGRLARGAHDVAASWWAFSYSAESRSIETSLFAGWIEPASEDAFALLPTVEIPADAPPPEGLGRVSLAALGDTFFATHVRGSELHVVRFTRAAGVIDAGSAR